jgi:RNA polymerase sigma-70 factor (ECF subfamily)
LNSLNKHNKNDVNEFKAEYEKVILEYNQKLLWYAKRLCNNNDQAEEITQETLLTGFQHFGTLNDKQKVFPWLKTIAKRIYLRKFSPIYDYELISIDAPVFDGSGLSVADTIVDDSIDIEGNYMRNELCRHILNEVGNLSEKQRDSIIYRYVHGFSVKETAASLNMTGNSVKVSSHVGLEKVKERLKDYFIKGEYIMNCKEAYAYLHQYAKGKISAHEKEEVQQHINVCKGCRDIASSLTELEKHIVPAQDKEHRNYVVNIQLDDDYLLTYVSVCMAFENHREVNEKIEEWAGEVPFEAMNLDLPSLSLRFSQTEYLTRETLARFGDGGFRWTIEEYDRNEAAVQYRYTKINKVCNPHEMSLVFLTKEKMLKQSVEHPDLIHGYAQNWHRRSGSGKIGVYLAVPSGSKNLRIKQGDNVVDCGVYKFVYADRHTLENEHVTVNFSYIQ